MVQRVIESVVSEFGPMGWALKECLSGHSWRLEFKPTKGPSHKVYLSHSDQWIYCKALLEIPSINTEIISEADLHRRFLELNCRTHLCRYALDSQGNFLINAEVPMVESGFTSIALMLEAVGKRLEYHTATAPLKMSNPVISNVESEKHNRPVAWIAMTSIQDIIATCMGAQWRIYGKPKLTDWHFVYQGWPTEFNIFVTFSENWVYIQAPVIGAGARIQTKCEKGLFQYLLQINNATHLGGFGLAPSGEILFTSTISADVFSEAAFGMNIDMLETYFNRYFDEVSIASQQPEFAGFLDKGEEEFRLESPFEIKIVM